MYKIRSKIAKIR